MFDSVTRKPQVSKGRLALVVALTAAIGAAQAAVFAEVIARPLAGAIQGVRALPPRSPARDDLPEFVEEIAVTAPRRTKRPAAQARGVPWRDPDPVMFATFEGYCPVVR